MKNIYTMGKLALYLIAGAFLLCPASHASDVWETRPGVFKGSAMGTLPHSYFQVQDFGDFISEGKISHFSTYGSASACEHARERATSLALTACLGRYSNCAVTQEIKDENQRVCRYIVFVERNAARRRTSLNEDKRPAVTPRSDSRCDSDRDPACAPYASDAS